ncbi:MULTISPECIES: helix-turn-helix domain-containing protein [Streptomyces]|uniref:HTH cro/C1-type domain-containing protein n=1 Tax=Streptomyces chartreusis NRRL 3882 TaxID=1079985 RepID=A0A2N9BA02_STRCX|nr:MULTISPECIES: helix-turn-helix transcriptional regulator [Streptomyces]MYS91091.1 helix-turn-helix domain-containing protein [Streptomyces sp. SID5464]SOR80180.1 hypothetical protein SCNRRL3882_3636 [Streptomyces chartreusis NRRL 3882]
MSSRLNGRWITAHGGPLLSASRDHARVLAQRVRALREVRGWTRERLAKEAGIAVGTPARLESEGAVQPGFFTVGAVAEALEVSRMFLRQYGTHAVEEKLRERWFDRMISPEKAVHCFIGNVAARPKTFLLLGLFYSRRDVVQSFQESLFDL